MLLSLNEASKPKVSQAPVYKGPDVVIKRSKFYDDTSDKHIDNTVGVESAIEQFVKHKTKTPMEPFGSKDYALGNKGNFGNVTGLKHAGLTNDVSVFYTLEGNAPKVIKLYGVASHDEAGIGQPGNPNRQKNIAKKFANQVFEHSDR